MELKKDDNAQYSHDIIPLVRLVSDVVHFNSHSRYKYKNIDDLVLGKADERRYYGSIGKFRKTFYLHITMISTKHVYRYQCERCGVPA